MFRVSGRSAWIRAFERTKIYGHPINTSKNFPFFRFFWKKTFSTTFLILTFLIACTKRFSGSDSVLRYYGIIERNIRVSSHTSVEKKLPTNLNL